MLTISTFNIKNDQSPNKHTYIKKYLLENKIDILNLQEVYPLCAKKLEKNLVGYKMTGDYRYLAIPHINESNPIITNKNIISTKTYRLPHFPALLNRIITKTVINIADKNVTVFNTHLDYKYESVKIRQLNFILRLVEKEENPIILTGDFNLKNNKKAFNDFVTKMEKLNIYRVPIAEKTFKPSKYKRAIDHIFLSKEFKLLNKRVVKDINTSDHYPVLVEVLFK